MGGLIFCRGIGGGRPNGQGKQGMMGIALRGPQKETPKFQAAAFEQCGSFGPLLGGQLPLVAEASGSSAAILPKLAPGEQVAAKASCACS